VRLDSNLGEGTIVDMYLPKSVERPAEAKRFSLAPIRAASGHETVLVVEDDPDVLDIAVSGLLDLGYNVKTARDAPEALAILRTHPDTDVLFSDVVMPGGINGAQLAVEAQRICPGLKVLLTSGYAAPALSQDHGLPETLEVLRKPYRREELAQKIRLGDQQSKLRSAGTSDHFDSSESVVRVCFASWLAARRHQKRFALTSALVSRDSRSGLQPLTPTRRVARFLACSVRKSSSEQ
jgi:CheY-like chemotaxis protein